MQRYKHVFFLQEFAQFFHIGFLLMQYARILYDYNIQELRGQRIPLQSYSRTKEKGDAVHLQKIESGDDLPSRGVTTQVLSAC